MELKDGDIVVLLYNHVIGRVEKTHNWQPLHDILGLDGFKYPNQLASELVLIRGLNKATLERLTHWCRHRFCPNRKEETCLERIYRRLSQMSRKIF